MSCEKLLGDAPFQVGFARARKRLIFILYSFVNRLPPSFSLTVAGEDEARMKAGFRVKPSGIDHHSSAGPYEKIKNRTDVFPLSFSLIIETMRGADLPWVGV